MSTKNNKRANKSHKRVIPRKWIADTVGCSAGMVTDVKKGRRSPDTDLGTRIELADILLEEGIENVIDSVKKVVGN